jgi:hypothetical protein
MKSRVKIGWIEAEPEPVEEEAVEESAEEAGA